MQKTVLVFPSGMAKSLEKLAQLKQQGVRVIGSSSVPSELARSHYPNWEYLPYISEPDFNQHLLALIEQCGIDEIFTPNLVVWNYFSQHLSSLAPHVKLMNASPHDEILQPFRIAMKKAEQSICFMDALGASANAETPSVSLLEIASLHRYVEVIPGMCDDDKLQALITIAANTVPGDIVEIGTWWGKSAFALMYLGRLFSIGSVLCVDPWSDAGLVQGESVVDSGSAVASADEAFDVFRMNMLPFANGNINYLRHPSVEAVRHYECDSESHPTIRSPEFGTVNYAGRISILHIDGNHSLEAVRADMQAWTRFVLPGGWIVFDDYVWPYGTGPKEIGDQFLIEHAAQIQNSFVIGTALFVQLHSSLHF
jgi:cephalosporin hydroxylase